LIRGINSGQLLCLEKHLFITIMLCLFS
jgi:hypothetical protein